ncbi:pyrimidine-nucleoside phosphorylase [Desulforudis sp. 1088]|uniref:pyrimidine-nucleoside phosphorylase n=2 Tax=Candidatus Desulforudis TaxID=471826 RepID=UPI003CE48B80
MRAYDLILKKRNGGELSVEEIDFLVKGYTEGSIPDYQMAAFLMAVYFRGMSDREAADLTEAMVRSGDRCDLGSIPGIKVDKHSTGGVGDKTTLIVAPLAAAAGVPVAKMSGRGLGHTGGTVDKLESIPGFRTTLTLDEMAKQVRETGVAVVAQTGNLTPADKKLYALRDVTATVDSIPLIASSVMSKKLASGADAVVLDVKAGSGAFMKTVQGAVDLARAMVAVGERRGLHTVALVTGMDEPLGTAVGNALEVREAIDVLAGGGPEDLRELCVNLASYMVVLGRKAPTPADARRLCEELLSGGCALAKFREWISTQGGDPAVIEDGSLLPRAAREVPVPSAASGFVESIDAETVGKAASLLGAGRLTKESSIDPAVGVTVIKKVGMRVEEGEPLGILHVNDPAGLDEAMTALQKAYRFGQEPPPRRRLIIAVVTRDGVDGHPPLST